MADRFVVGDTVTLTNTFKVSGTATDPTAISLAVTTPDGTNAANTLLQVIGILEMPTIQTLSNNCFRFRRPNPLNTF